MTGAGGIRLVVAREFEPRNTLNTRKEDLRLIENSRVFRLSAVASCKGGCVSWLTKDFKLCLQPATENDIIHTGNEGGIREAKKRWLDAPGRATGRYSFASISG